MRHVERIARENNPDNREVRVWRGGGPNRERGISVLGTPLDHPNFVAVHLQKILEEHRILLGRIPLLSDLQSAWALLLHCASGRANYQLRSVRPELVAEFAVGHDQGMWQCLQTILNIPEESTALTRAIISLPLSLGGLGLRSATRTSLSAWWASWADTLPMIHARHPDVGMMILHGLNHEAQGPNVRGVADAVRMLTGVEGFEPPSWEALLDGARPPPHDPEDHEPG